MKLDRLSLILLFALAATRLLHVDAALTNALVLPFLIRVTLSMNAAALVNERRVRFAASPADVRSLSKAA